MEKVRVSKLMSEQGLCSRREADSYIERGWVFVDGERITELGTRIDPASKITLNKAAQASQLARVTILLNKPIGYVSAQPEPGYRPAVSLINAESHARDEHSRVRFSPMHLRGLAPAGRLDIDSTGLLVLTQDGRVARQLIGEDSVMEKEYLVRVNYTGQNQPAPPGQLTRIDDDDPVTTDVQSVFPPAMLAKLRHGLSLDGQALKPARVEWQNPEQLRFVLTEGKKRQIRRMCELVGLDVVGLKRIRIGKVTLGDLPLGQWRYLREDEEF